MNRRGFGGAAIAGIGGLLFPQKVEAKPYRGLSNDEMREFCKHQYRINRHWLSAKADLKNWGLSFHNNQLKLITVLTEKGTERNFVRYDDNYWQEIGGGRSVHFDTSRRQGKPGEQNG